MFSKEQTVEKLTELLAGEFEVDATEIAPESSLKETFGLHSHDQVDDHVLNHHKYGIKQQRPDFAGIKTFGEFCNLIIAKLDEPKA